MSTMWRCSVWIILELELELYPLLPGVMAACSDLWPPPLLPPSSVALRNFKIFLVFFFYCGSCLWHVDCARGYHVSIWLHGPSAQELFMSNHVSAHVRGSGRTLSSGQSDSFVHIKNPVEPQRQNSSRVQSREALTSQVRTMSDNHN